MSEFKIAPLNASTQIRKALSEILVEVVANGGSVSFMHPLAFEAADAFWERSLAAAARGERVVLGAFDGERLVGTVTLLLDCPPNQPHRAEIAKLMTRLSHRGRGVAKALMGAAERVAVAETVGASRRSVVAHHFAGSVAGAAAAAHDARITHFASISSAPYAPETSLLYALPHVEVD